MSHLNGLSFPLLKFSHTTDAIETKKWNWKHETRSIRLMFDNYGSLPSRQQTYSILSVLQEDAILERVDLLEKVHNAKDLVTRARQSGKPLKEPDDIPTAVLYRRSSCAIAIRYSRSISQTRRLQLKFESAQDFDRALLALQDLGCYMRGHDAQAPNDSVPLSEWPHSRPSSSAPISSNSNAVNTAALMRHDTDPPRSLYSDHFRPATVASETVPTSSQVQRSSTHAHPPQFSHRQRPSTPLFPINENESIHNDPVMANIGGFDTANQRVDPLRRRATVVSSQYNIDSRSESPIRVDTAPAMGGHGLSFLPSSASVARPSTASKITIAQLDNDLSSMIPPRRELPFKRPESRQSLQSRDGSTSRPSTSADLPSLPRPNFISPSPIDRVVPPSRQASRKEVALKESTSNADEQHFEPNAKEAKHFTKRPSTASSTQSKRNSAKASDRPSTALSASSVSLNLSNSTIATSHSIHSASDIKSDLRNALDCVGSAMTTATPQVVYQNSEKDDLEGYADMPHEDRMALLERLIVDGITDDNFVALCEDVYGCWQRIGFRN